MIIETESDFVGGQNGWHPKLGSVVRGNARGGGTQLRSSDVYIACLFLATGAAAFFLPAVDCTNPDQVNQTDLRKGRSVLHKQHFCRGIAPILHSQEHRL